MCSATSARSPAPRSSSSSERKCTWKRTSPSSSRSLASSPRWAASASSYASSTVCGTIERSSCSRSHGHSTRRRRVISSRRASASPERPGSLTGGLLRAGGWRGSAAATAGRNRYLLRRPARAARRDRHRLGRSARGGALARGATGNRRRAARRRGVRLRLRRVLALRDDVALRACGHVLRALLPVLHEVVQRLLLLLRLEQVLDRRLHLRQRLLLRRSDLRDAEDVVAELRLDRAEHLVLRRAEDRGVERLLLLTLGHARQPAALRLRRRVGRVLLRDLRPRRAGLDRLERGVGLRLLGGEHDLEVTRLGLREALLVLVVVVLDRGVGDGRLVLDDALLKLVREHGELHAEEQIALGLAGGLEELLVVGLLRERLLLLLLERRPDLLVGGRDVPLRGLLGEPLRRDQELQRLLVDAVVLLLALGLEGLGVGLRHALRERLLLLRGDALREVGRIGRDDLVGLLARALRLLLHRGEEPVLVLRLRDLHVADLGDGVRGDVVAAATGRDDGGNRERCEREEESEGLWHHKTVGPHRMASPRARAADHASERAYCSSEGAVATRSIASAAETNAGKRATGSSGTRTATVERPDS